MSESNGKNGRNGRKKARKKRKKAAASPNGSKMGRPATLTKNIETAFCALLAKGNYRDCAANVVGLPPSTLYRWLSRGKTESEAGEHTIYADFWEAVTRAESAAEATYLDVIFSAATDGGRTIEVVEERPEFYRDKAGRSRKRMVKTTKRQTVKERDAKTAIEFLQRKFKDKWGTKQKVEVEGDLKHQVETIETGQDKLRARFAAGERIRLN